MAEVSTAKKVIESKNICSVALHIIMEGSVLTYCVHPACPVTRKCAMATGFKSVTRDLKSRRKVILSQYSDEDLHQLRVNIRKLRALLKHCPE